MVNPIDGRIFSVGKGKRQRALDHLKDGAQTRKGVILKQIRSAGKNPGIDILVHGLRTAGAALRVDAAEIREPAILIRINRRFCPGSARSPYVRYLYLMNCQN